MIWKDNPKSTNFIFCSTELRTQLSPSVFILLLTFFWPGQRPSTSAQNFIRYLYAIFLLRALPALNTQGYSQISEEKAPHCFTKLPVTCQTAIEMEFVSASRPHIDSCFLQCMIQKILTHMSIDSLRLDTRCLKSGC